MNMKIENFEVRDKIIPVERIIALIRKGVIENATITFVQRQSSELNWILAGEVSTKVGLNGLGLLDKTEE